MEQVAELLYGEAAVVVRYCEVSSIDAEGTNCIGIAKQASDALFKRVGIARSHGNSDLFLAY